jgi:prolyl-tRNA synthetase
MAAAVEQHHDDRGIVWPASIAPYDVHVLALTGGAADVAAKAEEVAAMLAAAGYDVLLDDRDARPGEKFADADLVGCPVRITVGRRSLDDGAVDARRRDGDTDERVMIESVVKWVDAP